jgi:hypothetical protein
MMHKVFSLDSFDLHTAEVTFADGTDPAGVVGVARRGKVLSRQY